MINSVITVLADIFPIIPLATGRVILGQGTHEVQIGLPARWWITYSKAFLYTEEPSGSVPACIGDKNLSGATLINNTIIIYADIQSSSCTVTYRVY